LLLLLLWLLYYGLSNEITNIFLSSSEHFMVYFLH
jgi:hypothetical protein